MLIGPAVMSLVHRNYFLNWLETQWMLSKSLPTRGVEEERGRYLAIMNSAVIVLASRGKDKSAKLAGKAADKDDGDEGGAVTEEKVIEEEVVADKEWSLKGRDWAGSVERIVIASVKEAGESAHNPGVTVLMARPRTSLSPCTDCPTSSRRSDPSYYRPASSKSGEPPPSALP
jgi:hypothetical protein